MVKLRAIFAALCRFCPVPVITPINGLVFSIMIIFPAELQMPRFFMGLLKAGHYTVHALTKGPV